MRDGMQTIFSNTKNIKTTAAVLLCFTGFAFLLIRAFQVFYPMPVYNFTNVKFDYSGNKIAGANPLLLGFMDNDKMIRFDENKGFSTRIMDFSRDGKTLLTQEDKKVFAYNTETGNRELLTDNACNPCFGENDNKVYYIKMYDNYVAVINCLDITTKKETGFDYKIPVTLVNTISLYHYKTPSGIDRLVIADEKSPPLNALIFPDEIVDWQYLYKQLDKPDNIIIQKIKDKISPSDIVLLEDCIKEKTISKELNYRIINYFNKIIFPENESIIPPEYIDKVLKGDNKGNISGQLIDRQALIMLFSEGTFKNMDNRLSVVKLFNPDKNLIEKEIEIKDLIVYDSLCRNGILVLNGVNELAKINLSDGSVRRSKLKFDIDRHCYSWDGQLYAGWNQDTGELEIIDTDTGKTISRCIPEKKIHTRIMEITFSNDNKYVASCSIKAVATGAISIYEVATGKLLKTIKPVDNRLQNLWDNLWKGESSRN